MRINVSEAYREEFEVFISEYQELCDALIDLVVETVPIEKLKTYCRRNHPDVMMKLADTVSSRDIMRRILNKCSITNITPLEAVIQHCSITVKRIGMIRDYQHSLDEYVFKLRARYLLGSSIDIVNAETIIFILDWTPGEASFPNINHLLYEAFCHLDKKIIVLDTGKKILHLLYIYHYNVTNVPFFTHTHNCVSTSLLLYVV